MDAATRSSAIAAAVILVGFGLLAFFLPTIMIWVGSYSTGVAAVVGVLFVLLFFAIFWLRGRSQARRHQIGRDQAGRDQR